MSDVLTTYSARLSVKCNTITNLISSTVFNKTSGQS